MSEQEREMEPVVMGNVGVKPDKRASVGKKIGIFFLILIGLLVLLFIATLMIKSYNRSRYKDEFYLQQEVSEYLEERYNEEFIVMFNRGMSGAYNYMQLYAYPMAYQDEMHKIEIQGYYNKWGKMDFYDDYVMIKLTEEYEAYIDPIIDEYFDEYKFYLDFNAEWLTNNLPADTKLEDLWGLKANEDYPLPRIYLFLKQAESDHYNEKIVNGLSEKLQEKKVRGHIEIKMYDDDKYYEMRNRDNIYEEIGANGNLKATIIYIYSDKIDIRNRGKEK